MKFKPALLSKVLSAAILAILLLYCQQTKGTVVITSISTRIPNGKIDLYYRQLNGEYDIVTVNQSRPYGFGSAKLDWLFPEKENGEYIKIGYPRPYPDLEKLYYKSGRFIYKASLAGEQKVFEIPKGEIKLEMLGGSDADLMFLVTN
ncbi:hypothetical protein HDV01_004345 [Terramyces sp. JEL0728]|nr:hypothetical protein HDV01_004345 [Terramyces sp. JEL0728]